MRVALLAMIATLVPVVAHAQPAAKTTQPPTAMAVLANVEAMYKTPKHLSARFEQTVVDPTFGRTTVKTGTLQASKPDKFRFNYAPTGRKQERRFLYDGKTLWVVEPMNLQILKHATQSTDLPASFAFFSGAGTLTSQFRVAITTAKPYAIAGATVLRLTPKQPSAQYSELYLVVDPSTWQVTRTTVINSSGLASTFAFTKLDLTSAIAPSVYQFDPASEPAFKVVEVK